MSKYRRQLRNILSLSRKCHPRNLERLPCTQVMHTVLKYHAPTLRDTKPHHFIRSTAEAYCGFVGDVTFDYANEHSVRSRLRNEGKQGLHPDFSPHRIFCKRVRFPWFPLVKHTVCAYHTMDPDNLKPGNIPLEARRGRMKR